MVKALLSHDSDEELALTYCTAEDAERAEAALEVLQDRIWPDLFSVALGAVSYGHDAEQAADIALAASLQAIEAIRRGRRREASRWQPIPGGSFRAWACEKTRWNVKTVEGNHYAHYAPGSGKWDVVPPDMLDELVARDDTERHVVLKLTMHHGLAQLEPGDLGLLVGHHLEGHSQASLAAELGVSPSAVCRRRKRAANSLRGYVGAVD
ncbi:MAG: sigma-70 family RNA polymerase sigma factor [Armatimonadetes bacterium]|nr:sigma-70 family RNA polymerase sigma factor [Armatimonadota bacterium]